MQQPIFKQIVLVGGGHAHALLIKMWGMNPLSGVQLVLVSPSWRTPYSGMLPGLLAGHYSEDDVYIDLRRLCRHYNVRFIEERVTGIDTAKQTLSLSARHSLSYDLLSLDIGSTPDTELPGVKEFAQGIKPISVFYPRFLDLLERCRKATQPLSIAIVGAGAGGVEVMLALATRLKKEALTAQLTLVARDNNILQGYARDVVSAAEDALANVGVIVKNNFSVAKVTATEIVSSDDRSLSYDEVFFCTQAKAAIWLSDSGLACDERGFVLVRQTLESVSHRNIFAAGDIAAMQDSPRAKAGVFAVRQAPILFENLRRALLQTPLKEFQPQREFLSLLSLGGKKALANRANYSLSSPLLQSALWAWKNTLDRRFMAMFTHLSVSSMTETAQVNLKLIADEDSNQQINPLMRCSGCGGKVGTDILQQVLLSVTGQTEFAPEDAATVTLKSTTLIQSVDQIKAPLDDPYLFGRIAALHALSDAYAMGAAPTSAQLLLNLPYAGQQQQTRELTQLMHGVVEELTRADCKLLGGHTAEGADLSVGLVVNAERAEGVAVLNKGGAQPGDFLVLTKKLGSGVILAAHMPNAAVQTRGDWLNGCVLGMLQSNRAAAEVFAILNASACTDVTGFGLLGHLGEMLRASGCAANIHLDAMPFLEGALELSKQGVRSSIYSQNYQAIKALSVTEDVVSDPRFELLFDPQTSGGLLASLSAQALAELKQSDIAHWVIGDVQVAPDGLSWDLTIAR